ncbi:hypothetical protein [Algoriphagus sp. Y33]|uniref:hypothetical protein n=1 Tax=Algoriphagus sp. Y33 TaxID=2772483 RepID=UPI001642D0B6|nr:hypothetical protein [Algoriphagus sp. Y33]
MKLKFAMESSPFLILRNRLLAFNGSATCGKMKSIFMMLPGISSKRLEFIVWFSPDEIIIPEILKRLPLPRAAGTGRWETIGSATCSKCCSHPF